jgi:hypothetical protein
MTFATALRIAVDRLAGSGVREIYWGVAATCAELRRLGRPENAPFRSHARRDFIRYAFDRVIPVSGENERRARAAVAWLLRAQRATTDGGASLGYFPCSPDNVPWRPSYPETTGYIVTSLLAFVRRYDDTEARESALRMAHWEAAVQMSSGAVQGGPIVPRKQQTPAAFNTGMVLDGWCSAYESTEDARWLDAARRAADFLVKDFDDAGYYRTNGAFVKSGEIKTYTGLCARALYRLGVLTGESRYRDAALRSVTAALRQQRPNGWFAHNCLTRSDAPLTHTLGYTLQGLLEVGAAAGRDDFVTAVERTMIAVAPVIRKNGFLPGMFFDDWRPAALSSCLTGYAQLAIVGYRLHELGGTPEDRAMADRLVDFLKGLQALDAEDKNVNGALAGSFPIFGGYMRAGYPNWATKYLLDALVLQDRSGSRP